MDASRTSSSLLRKVAAPGEEAACAEFVNRYGPMVRALVGTRGFSPEDQEDIVQEILFAAVNGLREQRYDREQGRFKPWLKGLIYHTLTKAWHALMQRRTAGVVGPLDSAAIIPDTKPSKPPSRLSGRRRSWSRR